MKLPNADFFLINLFHPFVDLHILFTIFLGRVWFTNHHHFHGKPSSAYVKMRKSMYPPVSSNMAGTSLNKMEVYSWKIIYKSISSGCWQIHLDQTITNISPKYSETTLIISLSHNNDISQYTMHFLNIGYTGYNIIVRS